MASVEPAGMIPNLNCSFGMGNSGSWSARFSRKVKGNSSYWILTLLKIENSTGEEDIIFV